MRIAMWVVPISVVASLLLVGATFFFTLLVALNGAEQTGSRIIDAFLVLLVLILIAGPIAGRWGVQKMARASSWSPWLVAPLVVVGTVVAGTAVMLFGTFLFMLVFGVR